MAQPWQKRGARKRMRLRSHGERGSPIKRPIYSPVLELNNSKGNKKVFQFSLHIATHRLFRPFPPFGVDLFPRILISFYSLSYRLSVHKFGRWLPVLPYFERHLILIIINLFLPLVVYCSVVARKNVLKYPKNVFTRAADEYFFT